MGDGLDSPDGDSADGADVRFYSVTAECRHMGGCGCRAAACCLKCPVDPCLLEEGETVIVTQRNLVQRNERIQVLRKAGVEILQLTKSSGLTPQSIYRILRVETTIGRG